MNLTDKHKSKVITNAPKVMRRGTWKSLARTPHLDWAIIFTFSVLVGAILVLMGVSAYLDLDQRLSAQASRVAGHTQVVLDASSLDKVIHEYADRESIRTDIFHTYLGPSDPSL